MPEGRDRFVWLGILALALCLRLPLLARQDLWVDEVFSLAVATGHSIEQAPALSRPELGDFVEPRQPVPPAELRRYLRHDSPPAGPWRVLRAVFISDTAPPLYYLLLWAWTLALGTGDAVLRLFSVFWGLASLPLLRSVARQIAGQERVALLACAFFAVAPVSLDAGVEGRMYTLAMFLGLLLAWASLALARRGWEPPLALLWIAAAAAGLLTHYFFVFVWLACSLWLLLAPGRLDRRAVPAMSLGMALLLAPWYLRMPEVLGHWRVAKGWLDGLPAPARFFVSPFDLAGGLFSLFERWGESLARRAPVLAVAMGLLLAFAAARFLRRAGRGPALLPGLWIAASCAGPLAFDLACRTQTQTIPRYAWLALPAAALFAGMLGDRLSREPRRVQAALLLLLLAVWTPGYRRLLRATSRHGDAFRDTATALDRWARPGDVVIVHSIPSGVLGIARYLGDGGPRVASWVQQLGNRRVPADAEALTAGRRRVAFLRVHEIKSPRPEEDWLRENAGLTGHWDERSAHLSFFDLDSGIGDFRIAGVRREILRSGLKSPLH